MNGEILGERYEVQKQLGKRTGRRTILVRDIKTQELAVIKLLLFGGDFQWHDLKLFEREAAVLKSLSHPAIPRYLDSLDLNLPKHKGFALVQTYIEAKSLEEQVKAGRRFTEAEVKQLAKSLLEILIYLHECEPPVIHRDIKPSNILLTNRSGNSVGDVYLVDFGSVQTLAAKEGGTITVVGTYGYMPPEQFGGRTVAASDLYGLGATLIYLITGTHPADLPQKDGQIQFEEKANISPSFKDWLKRMVQPYLDKRFTSARQALQGLEQSVSKYVPAESSQRDITNIGIRDITNIGIRKPAGSKIKLTKDGDGIDIIIPPTNNLLLYFGRFLSKLLYCILLCILVDLLSTFVIVLFFVRENFEVLIASSKLLDYMNIITPALLFLWTFSSIHLEINDRNIRLSKKLLGLKYPLLRPSRRQDIDKLVYMPKHLCNKDGKHSFEVEAKLIIQAGKKEYIIDSSSKNIREPEIDWLAHELSDYLGLLITQERQ